MKQKCKSLFCALLCLVLMCATVFPVWGSHYGAGVWHRCVSA